MSTSLMLQAIDDAFTAADNKVEFVNELRRYIHQHLSPFREHPVDLVLWLPADDVVANDYNPNSVAKKEMTLLHTSIKADGYTQPIVTVGGETAGQAVIVDGFHRSYVGKNFADIAVATKGHLPTVRIEKDMNDRMASTVRHNRARGKHSVDGMSSMVFEMLENGWTDEGICNELGMEPEELLRLKHITGFSKLFENVEYRKSWVTKSQILLEKAARDAGEL